MTNLIARAESRNFCFVGFCSTLAAKFATRRSIIYVSLFRLFDDHWRDVIIRLEVNMESSIRLVVKTPNQRFKDIHIDCDLGWTVKKVKEYLADAHPTNPVITAYLG